MSAREVGEGTAYSPPMGGRGRAGLGAGEGCEVREQRALS